MSERTRKTTLHRCEGCRVESETWGLPPGWCATGVTRYEDIRCKQRTTAEWCPTCLGPRISDKEPPDD